MGVRTCIGGMLLLTIPQIALGEDRAADITIPENIPESAILPNPVALPAPCRLPRAAASSPIPEAPLDRDARKPQVRVALRVLEVSLSKIRERGVDFSTRAYNDGKPIEAADILSGGYTSIALPDQQALNGFLDALVRNNLAKVLADPTISTISGQSASFHVGGEFPVPSADGKAPVEFRPYGTQVNLTADVQSDTRVRLHVHPRISALDYDTAIEIAGTKVPGLKIRQCDFTSDVALGESAVVSGLLETRVDSISTDSGVREKINEIALVIVVTPELVATSPSPTASVGIHDIITVTSSQAELGKSSFFADAELSEAEQSNNVEPAVYKIPAQVTNVRSDGTLVIESCRCTEVNGVVVHRKLSGVVRTEDIENSSHTIPMNRVAELRLDKVIAAPRQFGTISDPPRRPIHSDR